MDLLPGFCQGIVRVFISYPFDAVKVMSQANNQKPLENVRQHIYKNPSIFYRGVGIPMITVSIDRSLQYKYFEQFKSRYDPYLLGAAIGVLSSILSVPMQFITSNVLLISKAEYRSMYHYLRTTFQSQGFRPLIRGYSLEAPRSVLATSIYLGTYGNLRKAVSSDSPTPTQTTVSAIGASWSSWICVFPMDTIRTLYQTEKTHTRSISALAIARYREFGLLSFWRGLTPVLLRTAPSSVFGMLAYEFVRKSIQ